jgi:hypothetical protein
MVLGTAVKHAIEPIAEVVLGRSTAASHSAFSFSAFSR